MGIYKISYLSQAHTVYGYLGVPGTSSDITSVLRDSLTEFVGYPQSIVQICFSIQNMESAKSERYPLLVYCRGGIGRVGQVRLEWIAEFLRCGVAVFAPCYRGSEGGEGRDEFGGDDVNDVLAGVDFCGALPFIDSSSTTLLGFSRGSINATKASLMMSNVMHLILWGGIADLAAIYADRVDLRQMLRRVTGGTPARMPEEYRVRSPLAFIKDIPCPVTLVHGTADLQVSFRQALAMKQALQNAGTSSRSHFYQGLGHHLPLQIHRAVVERMLSSFEV